MNIQKCIPSRGNRPCRRHLGHLGPVTAVTKEGVSTGFPSSEDSKVGSLGRWKLIFPHEKKRAKTSIFLMMLLGFVSQNKESDLYDIQSGKKRHLFGCR